MTDVTFDPAALDALLNEREPIAIDVIQAARLRELGCAIEEPAPGRFLLRTTSMSVWSDYLAWRCPFVQRTQPQRIIDVYRETASTQDAVRRLIEARSAAADGALVIADRQSAGRGRLGRVWQSPPGACVLVSRAVVSRDAALLKPDRLAIASAVAAAVALTQAVLPRKPGIGIKWPNDIVVEGRKIAGILVETVPAPGAREQDRGQDRGLHAAIIGIGVNVALREDELPADLKDRATSLAMLGCEVDRLAVLAHLVRALDGALSPEVDADWLVRQWRGFNVFSADTPITFGHNGSAIRGCVIDLDASEGLIVRTQEGQIVRLPAASTSVERD